jgi:hypothetical protein
VAEVSAGESVQIVAQGDGVELTNPILSTADAEDVQNQDTFIGGRVFENWFKKGATPREILCSLLTTKGGFTRSVIRQLSNGRFFNENPYGIVHFGDPQFNKIFAGGECTQNIYEGGSHPGYAYKGNIPEEYGLDDAPKLSTQVYGKSYWDIMNFCAGASLDYMCGVVPFGLRSSIFLGAPRFYHAYDYDQVNIGETGQTAIREKRKPYQQYHIYTSYSDIIANTITASEADVRTCAVGLYSYNAWLGSSKQSRVGPMWVDYDIYPEKQKTMTVDTQYIDKGTVLGDFIPFMNYIEQKASSALNIGGYQVAWRMTASALKDTVKDMYKGELIVMGDPTVKPNDRMWLSDSYERMQGNCGVEAVVQTFNAQDGYITSVYPDCNVVIDDRYEKIINHMGNSVIAPALALYAINITSSLLFSHTARPLIGAMLPKHVT